MLKGIFNIGGSTIVLENKEQYEKFMEAFKHMTVIQAVRTVSTLGLTLGA